MLLKQGTWSSITHETIFLTCKCFHVNNMNQFLWFVEYSNTFSNARHEILGPVLLQMGFLPHIIQLISSQVEMRYG